MPRGRKVLQGSVQSPCRRGMQRWHPPIWLVCTVHTSCLPADAARKLCLGPVEIRPPAYDIGSSAVFACMQVLADNACQLQGGHWKNALHVEACQMANMQAQMIIRSCTPQQPTHLIKYR